MNFSLFSPKRTHIWLLIAASLILILGMLGARDIWTQEWRWADICQQMIIRHDYLHPYFMSSDYYDKPLLSYWLIILTSYISGGLNLWAIRLYSAIGGLIAVACTYVIGKQLFSKQVGMTAGWLLITTFYFIFWSRTGLPDIPNVAGILLAITCYLYYRNNPSFLGYCLFFLIIAITCLLKGVVAAVIVVIALLPDLLYENRWLLHFNWKLLLGLLPGLLLYLLPFWASAHFNPQHYAESGLKEVFEENIVRYVHPFDHENPFYIYFIYMPAYTVPWILFFIPALISSIKQWNKLPHNSRWLIWANILIFLFFTGSGSRRNYYILPIVPFVILVTADWLTRIEKKYRKTYRLANGVAILALIISLLNFVIITPLFYSGGGPALFAKQVRQQAEITQPWANWHITMLDPPGGNSFYLNSPNLITFHYVPSYLRKKITTDRLLTYLPDLKSKPKNNVILITREGYLPYLKNYLSSYKIIFTPKNWGEKTFHLNTSDNAIALLPT